jgi:micrococcal nuclease
MNQPGRPRLRLVADNDRRPARRRRGWRLPFGLKKTLASISMAAAVFGAAVIFEQLGPTGVDAIKLSSIPKGEASRPLSGREVSARPMPVCGFGKRTNCIVDGDTFWLDGTKYRISNIDTPELKGKCGAEQSTAKRARQRLAEMINGRPVRVSVTGTDPYGRKLVIISDANGDIGDRLVGEGLAEVWGGDFIDWCRG